MNFFPLGYRRVSYLLVALVLAVITGCHQSTSTTKDSITVALTLEPSGLDPSAGAGSAISEVVLYNVFETLTKLDENAELKPLLARSWSHSADFKTFTFELEPQVKFHNGVKLDAAIVKYSLTRPRPSKVDAAIYDNIAAVTVNNPLSVNIKLKRAERLLPELLAQGSAIIVEPSSAANNATHPIGTGPFEFVRWQRGASVELKKSTAYRQQEKIKLNKATFRFITDPNSANNALLSGDIDYFPRGITPQNAALFSNHPELKLLIGNSSAKTIIAMNHDNKDLNNVLVRRAISMAINRQELIDNVADGYAIAIGSHYAPNMPEYIDTSDINKYDLTAAKQLLAQAQVNLPLQLSLKLPPVFYARQAGEIVAAQLKKIAVNVDIEYVDWARWLNEVYSQKNYDLTIISHVERYDLDKPASNGYYFNYRSAAFNRLLAQSSSAATKQQYLTYLQQAQQLLAKDAVSVYLYNPQWLSVANKRLQNIPSHFPLFTTELGQISWQQP